MESQGQTQAASSEDKALVVVAQRDAAVRQAEIELEFLSGWENP